MVTILRLLFFARVLYLCVDKLREKWTGGSAETFNTSTDLLFGVHVVLKAWLSLATQAQAQV